MAATAKTAKKTFETQVSLPANVRTNMIALLNQEMADMFDLFSQTKQAHWNVKGMHFIALHELFDMLAEPMPEYVDMMAERVTALGGMAEGTARMAVANTRLPEFPSDNFEGTHMVRCLVDRFGMVANNLRAAIDTADDAGDMDTADLFTELSRNMDKHLYFLESHIQK